MESIKDLANLGGQVTIVVLFLGYLIKKDNLDKIKDEGIDKMINNHFHTSNGIIKANNKALNKVFNALEKLLGMIGKNTVSQDIGNRGGCK